MSKNRGFTLIELIIVIAIIGLMAAIILPRLNFSQKSQLTNGLQTLSSQVRATYDEAIFSGRVHRMIFNVRTGEFWTERAPKGFSGRAPVVGRSTEPDSYEEDKKKLLEKLNNQAKAENYFNIEIPFAQRDVLDTVDWNEVKTPLIFRQTLPGKMIFSLITTGLSNKKFEFKKPDADSKKNVCNADILNCASVYFFPGGLTSPVSFRVAFKNKDGDAIDGTAGQYTLNLNTLTGRLHILQGEEDANFTPPQ